MSIDQPTDTKAPVRSASSVKQNEPEPLSSRLNNWCLRWIAYLAASRLRAGLLVGLVACIMYLPGQTNLPAIDRTESAVALSSLHILDSGNWLQPQWGENVQRTRPIATFWVQALSAAANPEDARTDISIYRLPSFVSSVAAVVLLFWLGCGLVGTLPAFVASLAIAVTPIVALHAGLAIAEPLVLPAIIIAQLALLAIYRDPAAARWWGWLGAFWAAVGISTWFNALAVALLALVTILTLAAWDRRAALIIRLKPWLGLPLMGLMALPWLWAVWIIDEGTLYRGMGLAEIVDALEGGQSMKFKTAYGVFVLTLLLGFVPIAHMLGPVVSRYLPMRRDPTLRFLLVWLIAPVVALELLSNKPPLYTVQAVMPAGALLVALAMVPGSHYTLTVKAWPGMFWGTAVLLLLLAPALVGGLLWITETPVSPLLVSGFLTFAGLFLLAAWVSARGLGMAWFACAITGTFIFGLWFNGLLMPGLKNFWTAPQLAELAEKLQRCAPGPVHITGFREPSLALAVAGKAQIGSATQAATALRHDQNAYAIISSREYNAFQTALAQTAPDTRADAIGCVRSFNVARGCSLLFTVYTDASRPAVAACKPLLADGCEPKHALLNAKLQIKHCN